MEEVKSRAEQEGKETSIGRESEHKVHLLGVNTS